MEPRGAERHRSGESEDKSSFIRRVLRMDSEFTASERNVCRYVLEKQFLDQTSSVKDVAAETGVSEATVTRFCKRAGLRGFGQLRDILSISPAVVSPEPIERIDPEDTLDDVVHKTFQTFRDTLNDTEHTLDRAQLMAAVRAVTRATKVELYGNGVSGYMARHAAVRLMSLGVSCATHDLHAAQLTSVRLLQRDDVAFIVSHSGENPDMLRLADLAQARGAPVIAMTGNRKSRLVKRADIPLITARWDLVPAPQAGPSRLAQLLGLETLVSAVHWAITREPEAAFADG